MLQNTKLSLRSIPGSSFAACNDRKSVLPLPLTFTIYCDMCIILSVDYLPQSIGINYVHVSIEVLNSAPQYYIIMFVVKQLSDI